MIVNRQRRVSITLRPLDEFCESVRRELQFPDEGVVVCLISDPAIARLNRTFRGKHGPTDVLSFPAVPDKPHVTSHSAGKGAAGHRPRRGKFTDPTYVGDIAISPETARRNARRFSRALTTELRILILHGMIHLAGYDHETDDGQMERFERRLRRRFGLKT